MKKTTVKGFTLIELIVVTAIFGIIMASATMLMVPTSKIMTSTEVQEQGNAAVTNITRFLEGELGTAEYIRIYNGKYTTFDASTGTYNTANLDAKVEEFIKLYYGGIIKGNSTADSPNYASGKFRVLQIDNERNGIISEWIYDCSNLNEASIHSSLTKTANEYAVNKAYYTDFSFEFKPGIYDTVIDFDNHTVTSSDIIPNFKKENVSMTIKATCNRNKTDYSFVSTMGVPMVNQLFGRNNASSLQGVYYCVITKDGTKQIVDRGTIAAAEEDPAHPGTAQHENIIARYKTDNSGDNKGYTFIYAFGSEINTNP